MWELAKRPIAAAATKHRAIEDYYFRQQEELERGLHKAFQRNRADRDILSPPLPGGTRSSYSASVRFIGMVIGAEPPNTGLAPAAR